MVDKPADHDARRRALDPTRSFIVQAPAGSGKTELLVRRFLVLLARVPEPERIVAITFTRKAAAEMRTRVIAALRLAHGPRPTDAVGGALWGLARSALANDERHGWQLEIHPTRLRIQTIDALSAALTRQMPWLSRLGGALGVIEDADELYRAAAEATVRRLGALPRRQHEALADLIAHLDTNLPRLIGLLIEMLRHRDQWLRHVVSGGGDTGRRRAAEQAWVELVEAVLRAAHAVIPVSIQDDLPGLARFAAAALAGTNSDSPIVACQALDAMPPPLAARLPEWRGLAELLLTKRNKLRRSVSVRLGFGRGSDQRRAMQTLLATLDPQSPLVTRLVEIRGLPGPRFEERQWRILKALIEILPVAAAQLKLVFRERGCVDFPEITESARLALGAVEEPTELALRLDYRIEHLLVDEFQDTSVSQFELLEQLTHGWQDGDGRTLFLVGDPMQSIYRFRAAEVGLFLSVMANGWGQIPMDTLTLTVNFRSERRIVGWINAMFPGLFPRRNEPARGAVTYVPFAPRDAEHGTDGEVEIHAIAGDQHAEAARVVAVVQAALDDPDQQTVAILVRSRAHLGAILPALKRAGIAFYGLDIVPLSDQPVIVDLMAVVRALLMPADRIAWLAVLRAPWCGLTLADIHVLAPAEGATVWDALCDVRRRALLSVDGRARVERCAPILERAVAARGRGSLRARVENAWVELGGPACVTGDQLADAQTFFGLLSQHEVAADLADLAPLQRAVTRLWARPDPGADQSVQVMTLHKAKGLEFDTVIIPGLARTPPPERRKLLIWEEYARDAEAQLLLAPLAEPGREHDPHYRFVRRLHAEKEEFETLRLLYVGCTRARRSLHLFGQVGVDAAGRLRAPPARSLQERLWSSFEAAFSECAGSGRGHTPARPAAGAGDAPPLRRLALGWQPPQRPAPTWLATAPEVGAPTEPIEFAWAGETARQIGVLVHAVLQWMGEEGLDAWNRERLDAYRDQWRAELLAAGVPGSDSDLALGRVVSALTHVLIDPRAAWILNPDHQAAHNEMKISAHRDGGRHDLVVDRTFIDATGVRWVIDYKTSSHEGGDQELFLDQEVERYRRQLETYADVLGADEDRPIRLGLYFPLLKAWREWPFRT